MIVMDRIGAVSERLNLITRFSIGDGNDLPGPGVDGYRFLFQCPRCKRVALATMSVEELGDSWLEDGETEPPKCNCDETKG